jgi:Flp pilus assembly protein TadG
MPLAGRTRSRNSDQGSAAVELVLLTPLLVLMMLLAVALGRLVETRPQTDSAARQAARAASLAGDPATAAAEATATARAALTSENITCSGMSVTTDTAAFRPGGQVTVQVSCTVSLSGLALLHLPGSRTLTSRFSSPIDLYRGTGTGFTNPEHPWNGS